MADVFNPNEIIRSWYTMMNLLGALEQNDERMADALGPADEAQGLIGWSRAMELLDGNGQPITFPVRLVSETRIYRGPSRG